MEFDRRKFEQCITDLVDSLADIDELVAELESSKRHEAVCQCGTASRRHYFTGFEHGFDENMPPCPFEEDHKKVIKLTADLDALTDQQAEIKEQTRVHAQFKHRMNQEIAALTAEPDEELAKARGYYKDSHGIWRNKEGYSQAKLSDFHDGALNLPEQAYQRKAEAQMAALKTELDHVQVQRERYCAEVIRLAEALRILSPKERLNPELVCGIAKQRIAKLTAELKIAWDDSKKWSLAYDAAESACGQNIRELAESQAKIAELEGELLLAQNEAAEERRAKAICSYHFDKLTADRNRVVEKLEIETSTLTEGFRTKGALITELTADRDRWKNEAEGQMEMRQDWQRKADAAEAERDRLIGEHAGGCAIHDNGNCDCFAKDVLTELRIDRREQWAKALEWAGLQFNKDYRHPHTLECSKLYAKAAAIRSGEIKVPNE